MICPNCKQQTDKTITFETTNGTLTACFKCPGNSSTPVPAVTAPVTEIVRPERKKNFDVYALSEEEIKRTQELRPKNRLVDSELSRKMSDVELQKEGKIAIVQVGGDGRMRRKYIDEQVRQKISGNYQIIFDNGLKVVAEAVA